jgi:VanZ family protein
MSRDRVIDGLLVVVAAAILAVILVWSLGPAPPTGGFSFADKVEHAAAYSALTVSLLLVLVWRPGRAGGVAGRIGGAFVGCAVLGLGIALEIGQSFTGRDADWRDVLADGLGTLAGVLAWMLSRRLVRGPEAIKPP